MYDDRMSWDSITVASRIMIPAYVLFFAAVGANFVFTSEQRLTKTPALQFAQSAAGGLRLDGSLFLMVAALIAGSMLWGRRMPCLYALYVAAIMMSVWGTVQFVAVFLGDSSPSGWCWPALVCAACVATSRSLRRREV